MRMHKLAERRRAYGLMFGPPGIFAGVMMLVMASTVGHLSAAETLKFATSKSGWIAWIAEDRGFFKSNGADVKVELVTSGVAAANGLISDEYDLATMSEYAFVAKSFDNPDLRLIGTVGAISNLRLIGRRDLGIDDAASLAGKKIGLLEGAISQFFLGKLLDINGIDSESVTVVNLRPPALPDALAKGQVDAIVSWEPYANLARAAVDGQVVEINVQGGQSYYFTIAVKEKTLAAKPDQMRALIAALVEAADWAANNPRQAREVLNRKLGISLSDLERYWPDHVMDVTLTQDMVFLMSEEAIWRLENGLSKGNAPEFLDRINFDALQSVDPSRVSVIK